MKVSIDNATTVSVSLLIALLAAAFNYGTTTQSLKDLDRRMGRMETKFDAAFPARSSATASAGTTEMLNP